MNTAELVSTGNELLSGRTLNRHAQVLGAALRTVGIRLLRDTTVGDSLDEIAAAAGEALRRADVVVVSGGLGPTSDDMTRDALGQLLHRPTHLDPETVALLRERYHKRGLPLGRESERQALVLEGAAVLPNSVGAAPGQRLELDDGKVLFVLPGPPREFGAVLDAHVLPWLRDRGGAPVQERVFLLGGFPESRAARLFEQAGIPEAGCGVEIGYCAAPGQLEIRLTAAAECAAALEMACVTARQLLGVDVYAEERIPIETAILRRLFREGLTLATAEGGSLGLLAGRLAVPEEAAVAYAGGIVATTRGALEDELEVPSAWIEEHGLAAEPVARQMASAIRIRRGASLGCAVSPAVTTAQTTDAPEATVCIAIDAPDTSHCRTVTFSGSRAGIAEWCAQAALNQLWQTLRQQADAPTPEGAP
jgi:nicotinamide-nucleotide amidase